MMRPLKLFACTCALLAFSVTAASAQSGQIEGQVTDAETGEPLPGVNVVLVENGEATTQGAQTSADGYYSILQVTAGTYALRASFIGYATQRVEGVNVNINLTTEVNFELPAETVGMEEIVVQSQEPVVKRDVASSVANIDAEQMENVPVTSLQGIIGLQAGARGLEIRGSDVSELAIQVDGASTRSGRTNEPFAEISYTSISQVQVQSGGFNAEYGNVRSGLVNVVTKEGPRNRYTFDVITKYSAPRQDYFGANPGDPNSYWLRTYTDPVIAFEGTTAGCVDLKTDEGCVWDRYTREQYANPEFSGFNQIAQERLSDDDPSNDLTPAELKQVFDLYTSRPLEVKKPNYTFDAGFGGPVPGVSDRLGDLRFFASYRQSSRAYPLPLMAAEDNLNRTGRLKLTSNLAPNMKLQLRGMLARESGVNSSPAGFANIWSGGAGYLDGLGTDAIFEGIANEQLRKRISRNMLGGEFTHTLSSNTFYEVRAQRRSESYQNDLPGFADTTATGFIGTYQTHADEVGRLLPGNRSNPAGPDFGTHNAEARDSSHTAIWSASFDITHQFNRYMQVKAGADFLHENLDVLHGQYEQNFGPFGDEAWNWYEENIIRWNRTLQQGAVYAQTKLNFEGMVANIGLRGDYFDPSSQWYVYEPYTQAFTNVNGGRFEEILETERTKRQFKLSPRLGVSFPVTRNSKVFFNYGYFRQLLQPAQLFRVRQAELGAVTAIGNPDHPMPTTIQYELGYEQNLFDMFLVRLSGFYKAEEDQSRDVRFINLDGTVSYDRSYPLNYEDTRGLEVTLRKRTGKWVRGFANFTYVSDKGGDFGFGNQYENPTRQREYEATALGEISTPEPRPYARVNLVFISPVDFGPQWGTANPLGDWRLTLLGRWRYGNEITWTGGGGSDVETEVLQNNVKYKDDWNLDLRISKNINLGLLGRVQLFADVSNVLNLKQLNAGAFSGEGDENYLRSLHLPKSAFADLPGGTAPYEYVYGDDQPGDYRDYDVRYVPIEVTGVAEDEQGQMIPDLPTSSAHDRPLYYARSGSEAEGTYFDWNAEAGQWEQADPGQVDQVLEDKAYIDMPDRSAWAFLNPRRVDFGLRVTF